MRCVFWVTTGVGKSTFGAEPSSPVAVTTDEAPPEVIGESQSSGTSGAGARRQGGEHSEGHDQCGSFAHESSFPWCCELFDVWARS